MIPSCSKEFRYLACKACHTIFCDPTPSQKELAQYYANHFDYGWYERRLLLKKIQAWHRWRRLEFLFKKRGIKPGKLLDIGCGHGLFVRVANRAGWNALGLDFPSNATRWAQSVLGLNIVEDELTAAVDFGKIVEAQFDLITAWHCLEHSPKPVEFLSYCARLLKPGGKLLLAVPNAESHGMKKKREDWVWCQQPFVHVAHFNGASLARVAQRAGLNTILTWSRDTWDANRMYDEGIALKVTPFADWLFKRHPRVTFSFEEGSRLIFYTIGCFKHWLFNQECEKLDGSELLVLAEHPIQDIGVVTP